jgi:pimeloyl-ACP methyl ester carboxylesterase
MKAVRRSIVACLLILPWFVQPVAIAQTTAPSIGIVVMHGKGGGPGGLVKPLADGLEARGFRVANLQMPWSGERKYNADVAAAVKEVHAAVAELRDKGAKKIFLAGHSQGGVFAIYYAGLHAPDGLIVIAPGGDVSTNFYLQQVGRSVSRAKDQIAAGKGGETGDYDESEGGKNWTVRTTAAIYFSWFDPDGAMNQLKSSAALPKTLPVLHVAPTSDYPVLLRAKQDMFRALPDHPLKRLYEPNSDHRNAPRDAIDAIASWIDEVAGK